MLLQMVSPGGTRTVTSSGLRSVECGWWVRLSEGRKMERDPETEADGPSSRVTREGPVHPFLQFREV